MITGVAFAAPVVQNFTNIEPFLTDTYDNGTSTLEWLHVFTKNASTTNLSVSSLSNGNCVQAGVGGLLTTTGSACGAGGGGSSTFGTTSLSGLYPIVYTQNASLAQFSIAFGTTTSNTWAGTQTFANPIVDGTLSKVVAANNGTTYAVATSTFTTTGVINIVGGTGAQVLGGTGVVSINCSVAGASQDGCLAQADWNTFNNKQNALTATWPQILTGSTLTFGGLATTTGLITSHVPYVTGVNTFSDEATGTITCTGTASCGAGSYVLGNALTITATGSGGIGDPFTHPANFLLLSIPTSATTSIIQDTGGLIISSSTDPIAGLGGTGGGGQWPVLINNPTSVIGSSTGIAFNVTANNNAGPGMGLIGAGIGFIRQGNLSFGDLFFSTTPSAGNNTERMRITSTGSVGIGTTSPYAKLSVNAANLDTNTTLFAIASSTQSATTTLFSVDNTGVASTTKLFGSFLSPCTGTNALTWSGGVFGCTAQPQGTVTAVSVATANGFAGSSSGGATPALTITTSVTGLLKGNGTAISAAALTDFPTQANGTVIANGSGATAAPTAIATTTLYGTLGAPGQVLMSSNGVAVWAATSSNASASSAFSFTPLINFGINTSATTTAIWAQNGLFSSSTIQTEGINTNAFATKFYQIGGINVLAASSTSGLTLGGIQAGAALTATTSSNGNTVFGYQALQLATSSRFNTVIGFQAMNTGEDYTNAANVAIGYRAMQVITTGSDNNAIGTGALSSLTSGIDNEMQGHSAGVGLTKGSENVGIGESAAAGYTTGSDNIAIGSGADQDGTLSFGNVVIGYGAEGGGTQGGTGGNYNTILGTLAGSSLLDTGSSTILIGHNVEATSSNEVGGLDIGNVLYGTGMYNGLTQSSSPTAIGRIGIGTSTPTAALVSVAASTTAGTVQTAYAGVVSIIAGLENTVTKIFQEIDQWGDIITSGDTPTVTGGTSSVSGNQRNGNITVAGVAITSVTLTFAHPWPVAPDCVVSDNTTASVADITSISTTQVVFGLSVGINSGTLWYICQAHQ